MAGSCSIGSSASCCSGLLHSSTRAAVITCCTVAALHVTATASATASVSETEAAATTATVSAVSENHTVGLNSAASHVSAIADPKVWIVSFISILVISLVGLVCVAMVPLVRSTYYNHSIQFLVALAVGSLTGDAMLHLLPHAIVKSAMDDAHAERCHNEQQTVYKGLVALGGVYFFFIAEKLVALATEHRAQLKARQEEHEHQLQHQHYHQNQKHHSHQHNSHQQHHHHQYKAKRRSLYAEKSCDDIMTTGLGSVAMRNIDNLQHQADECSLNSLDAAIIECDEQPQQQQQQKVEDDEDREHLQQHSGSSESNDLNVAIQRGLSNSSPDKLNHMHNHNHGHHGHTHELPQSLASVALMVILGDGLHNFTDGLAIGAAFAQSITGGLSTSVAVLCHELPHELGDFAVLLKTGMKPKHALMYNMLSSILAAVGMIIGICLANVSHASYWIFAITGGMFIYISLVDMLPELNLVNVKAGESRIAHFVLQLAGIGTGVGVMFLIAIFEHDIKGMLGDNESHNEAGDHGHAPC